MLIKNQIYETVITDYTSEGQGVAHIEGCTTRDTRVNLIEDDCRQGESLC